MKQTRPIITGETCSREKESELRHRQKAKEQLDHLLNEIKDKLSELKLQLAGMEERLSVEFRIDLDAILDEPRSGDTPLEELTGFMRKELKKRLENMGCKSRR